MNTKAPNVPTKNAADAFDDGVTQDTAAPVDTGPTVEPLNADALIGMTVKLKKMPLKVDGKPLTEIIVPVRLTEDLQKMGEAVAEDMSMLSICSAYCGVHRSVIGKLHPDDFDDLQKAVIDFLPRFIREPLMEFHTALRDSLNNEQTPMNDA